LISIFCITLLLKKNKMNEFNELLKIMERLRDPEKGCPWDKIQTEKTLKEYIVEEAYELVEAIEKEDVRGITEELGDLLLQIVFISRILEEKGEGSVREVIGTLNSKLVRRHPHIFSDTRAESPAEVKNNWENLKRKEKKKDSILSDYPESMPSLSAAKRYGEQASSVGFDWGEAGSALDKVDEELEELKSEVKKGDEGGIHEELGDLLFSISNVARLTGTNPEFALRDANRKFKMRFRRMENIFRKMNMELRKASLSEMSQIWEKVKGNRD